MSKKEFSKITISLMTELAKEEAATEAADHALAEARAKFDVASRKYAAVRELVTKELAWSPYGSANIEFYKRVAREQAKVTIENLGQFRFLYMDMGDAIFEVLADAEKPLKLFEIAERLRHGGADIGDIRQVNAALMKSSYIGKTEDGKYIVIYGEEGGLEEPEESKV